MSVSSEYDRLLRSDAPALFQPASIFFLSILLLNFNKWIELRVADTRLPEGFPSPLLLWCLAFTYASLFAMMLPLVLELHADNGTQFKHAVRISRAD